MFTNCVHEYLINMLCTKYYLPTVFQSWEYGPVTLNIKMFTTSHKNHSSVAIYTFSFLVSDEYVF